MARETPQRKAIRRAIEEAPGPVAPNEVHEAAKREIARLGVATVYRTLRDMSEAGEIKAVELPGEPARYELAHLEHHHHFRCRKCQRVFDIEGCPGSLQSLVPEGFTLEDHDIVLRGLCAHCQD
ncbi:MAG: transcriptional repressor [Planctomycetota bacterium]